MKNISPCFKMFFCNRIPRSTETDYYFDPKIMTLGTPNFEPYKIQYKISEQEFQEMRIEMIKAGGSKLKKTKIIYLVTISYSILCLASWIFQLIFGFQVPVWIGIVMTVIPNMVLQFYWKSCMVKSCEGIARLFDRQNEGIYAARGLHWRTCYTLVYIHIRVLDSELQVLNEAREALKLRDEKTASVTIEEVKNIGNNWNKEVLLKHYQN